MLNVTLEPVPWEDVREGASGVGLAPQSVSGT